MKLTQMRDTQIYQILSGVNFESVKLTAKFTGFHSSFYPWLVLPVNHFTRGRSFRISNPPCTHLVVLNSCRDGLLKSSDSVPQSSHSQVFVM